MSEYSPLDFDASRFLAAREYLIDALTARSFYEQLKAVLEDVVGSNAFCAEGNEFSKRPRKLLFYRGQADQKWALTPILYRKIIEQFGPYVSVEEVERVMRCVEKEALEKSRESSQLTGLGLIEKFAAMQQYGVPTRLLDVTSDWRVALYFACGSASTDLDVDGRLFLLTIDAERSELLNSQDLFDRDGLSWSDNVSDLDKFTLDRSVWPIFPSLNDARIEVQKGSFLLGGLRQLKTDSMGDSTARFARCCQGEDVVSVISLFPINFLQRDRVLLPRFAAGVERLLLVSPGCGEESWKGWSSSAVTLRVPSKFKASLLELLREDGVSQETLFPNVEFQMDSLSEVVADKIRQFEMEEGSRRERRHRERMNEGILASKRCLSMSYLNGISEV